MNQMIDIYRESKLIYDKNSKLWILCESTQTSELLLLFRNN